MALGKSLGNSPPLQNLFLLEKSVDGKSKPKLVRVTSLSQILDSPLASSSSSSSSSNNHNRNISLDSELKPERKEGEEEQEEETEGEPGVMILSNETDSNRLEESVLSTISETAEKVEISKPVRKSTHAMKWAAHNCIIS